MRNMARKNDPYGLHKVLAIIGGEMAICGYDSVLANRDFQIRCLTADMEKLKEDRDELMLKVNRLEARGDCEMCLGLADVRKHLQSSEKTKLSQLKGYLEDCVDNPHEARQRLLDG